MPGLIAQLPSGAGLTTGEVIAFVLISIALLVVCLAIFRWVRRHETRLILLGLTVGVAGTGYAGTMTQAALAGNILLKIAVILVLGGVACSLVSFLGGRETAETIAPGRTSDEPVA
jgi:hypothetical protein